MGSAHNLEDKFTNLLSFLFFCHLFTHPKTHTQTMAHHDHRPPLSRHCVSGHVLCAVTLPIDIVAAVTCSPPSLPLPMPVLSWSVTITLFVAITIAVALFDAHQCAPSPPTSILICSDSGGGGSMAASAAAWRQQRQ